MAADRFLPCLLCVLTFGAGIADAGGTTIALPNGRTVERVDFDRHVMGLLLRTGCSSGSCHGSFQGKGGLYLSLFSYSPDKDYQAFTREGLGRRINLANPDQSLLLLKATGQVPHGGGVRFARNSYPYQVFREWIAQGARRDPTRGEVKQVTVTPAGHEFQKAGQSARLQVWAEFADGSKEDVTLFSEFRSNDDYVAEVKPDGSVTALRPGDTTAVITYRGNVRTARLLIPVPLRPGFVYPQIPEQNYLDREVFAKLRTLNIVPSELSSDSEFLRRITIDTIGTLPTPEEARAFLADTNPNKRARKVEELLAHPMHAALWATKFCDFTANNTDTMEQPVQLRSKRSKMWHDWFRVRLAHNVSYDQIVHGVLCATSRQGKGTDDWIKEVVEQEKTLLKTFDSNYAHRDTLDLFWRRGNNTAGFPLEQMAELSAAAFLGVRVECAQCHKHPFDRWTQTDYRGFANIFSQVKFGQSPQARQAITKANQELRDAAGDARNNNQIPQIREVFFSNDQLRRLPHPDTNQALAPRALGGPELDLDGDCREDLFRWLVQPDNPYFARIFVNRLWAHYFGVGLVEPVDNFSAANPPSNEKLLTLLAQDFIAHGFDIRHMERTILASRSYQLSSRPNESNQHDKNNFSRGYVRRMMAEVMVDVLNDALGTRENFGPDVPAGTRAVEVAPSRLQNANINYVFRVFGRPPRTTTCDCERSGEPALPQTLYLMTDQTLLTKINNGRLRQLLASKKPDREIVEELCLATLSRLPREDEQELFLQSVAKRTRQQGFADLMWALINSREFVLNH